MTTHYDYFVIGGGSGGVRSARIAAQHGASVGLAEKNALGGTCVNVGCVPKKLFTYAADYGAALSDMRGYGWRSPENVPFEWATLLQRKNAEIERLNGIYETNLTKAGVTLHKGAARFIDPHTIEIDTAHDKEPGRVSADKILIATGGRPKSPTYDGAEHVITSDDAFYLESLPDSVIIQGGGYISVEFAHIFHGLGVDVTVIHYAAEWLRGFDHDMRSFLREEYEIQGLKLQFETTIERVERSGNKFLVATDRGETLETGLVMAAIGRAPNTEKLGLSEAGLTANVRGQIPVNHNWQTAQPHIYAVGDVSNDMNLTPYAIAEGHILANRLYGDGVERKADLHQVATAIFSAPPMATVGLSEERARAEGHDIEIYKTVFRSMKMILADRQERTLMKMVVDKASRKVLGLHMVGADTPEMMQGVSVALNAGATKEDFDRTIGIHPTSAEEFVTMYQPIGESP